MLAAKEKVDSIIRDERIRVDNRKIYAIMLRCKNKDKNTNV